MSCQMTTSALKWDSALYRDNGSRRITGEWLPPYNGMVDTALYQESAAGTLCEVETKKRFSTH